MHKKSISQKNTLFIIGLMFFLIGMAFVVAGLLTWRANVEFFETALPTDATIVDIQTYRDSDDDVSHSVFVDYTVDGVEYEYRELGMYSSSMYIGKTVEIYYDPQDPGDIKSKTGSTLIAVIFVAIGGIFAVIGGVILGVQIKAKRKTKLKDTGTCIRLPITQIVTTNTSVNGVTGHVVICDNPDASGGTLNTYRSNPCYEWLSDYLNPGDIVAIYYDPANPNYYYVDIDDVQKVPDWPDSSVES